MMDELDEKEGRFISSVDLLNRTGLSRATLNNYIKAGMLPRPVVKKPNLQIKVKQSESDTSRSLSCEH